jgi:hypothetical protein
MYPASLTKIWLEYQGFKIYNKGNQILKNASHDKTEVEFSPLYSSIKLGNNIDSGEVKKKRISLDTLHSLGLKVVRDNAVWKDYQKCSYKLVHYTTKKSDLNLTNAGARVHFTIYQDPLNQRCHLEGKDVLGTGGRIDSGIGEWVSYARNKQKSTSNLSRAELRKRVRIGFDEMSDLQETEIPEVPLMITEEGYILCLKETIPLQRILIVGESGKGKSFCLNRIAPCFFWKYGHRVVYLIDPLEQFFDLHKPQNVSMFLDKLKIVGEEPRGLPIVNFYMCCADLGDDIIRPQKIDFKLSLDINEVLSVKYEFYFHGIENLKLSSIRYIEDYRKEFSTATSKKDIENIMFEKIPEARSGKDKGAAKMIYKYSASFDTIFRERFTSNMYMNDPAECHKWQLKYSNGTEVDGHPVIMAYEAGLVPIINVAMARNRKWFRNLLADIMQKIMRHQILKGKENQYPLWIVCDEMGEIYEYGKRRDKAHEAFEALFRQGRIQKMGFIGNTQSYSKLDEEWKKNATHLICVKIQDQKERKEIKERFRLTEDQMQELGDLETFEMMVVSKEDSDKKWVLYNKYGEKVEGGKVMERNAFRGYIIPPIVYHYSPGK